MELTPEGLAAPLSAEAEEFLVRNCHTFPGPARDDLAALLAHERRAVWREAPTRPRVVCLCGSTRFKEAFIAANYRETMAGRIVLTVGWFSHADAQVYYPTPEEKLRLDALHCQKIDMASEILVINPGGYIGESTAREIAHARATGKPVRYLSQEQPGGAE